MTTDKIDFKTKDVNREREALFIIIKRSIHQEAMTAINICMHVPNNRVQKHMKQNLRRKQTIQK